MPNTNRKFILLITLFFVIAVAGIACAPEVVEDPEDPADPDPVEEPQVIVFAVTETIDAMLPERTTGSSYSVHSRIFKDGLFRINAETNEPELSVASDWEISEDGLTYTFYLHEGIQWHRGYGELTADDIVFTFGRHIDPAVESVHGGQFWMLDDVVAVDDYTVEFHLNTPFGGFPYNLTIMHPGWGALISRAAFEDLGADGYNENPVGCGPFELVYDEWVPRELVVYERFDDYFKGKPEISRIEVRIIPDETTIAMAMEAEEIDITFFADAMIHQQYSAIDHLVGHEYEEVHINKMDLNTQLAPLDRPEVRWAVAHAIDTEGMIDFLFEGLALRPNTTILHPHMANVDSAPFSPVDYDPDRSRELLEEVGLEPGDIKMEGVTYSMHIYVRMAEFMNTGFAGAGLDITVLPLERGALHERRSKPDNHFVIISHPRWPDPDPFLSLIHGNAIPPHGINFTWWNEGDDLIDASRRTFGDERTAILTELQHLITRDMPQIPLWHRYGFAMHHERVKGFVSGPGASFRPFQLRIEE